MKKLIALLCALTLLFTFTACSGKQKDDTKADESVSSTDTAETKKTEKATEPTEVEQNEKLTPEQAAYLYNRAFTVASEWFNFSNPYWNTEDSFLDEKGFHYAINHETVRNMAELEEYLLRYFSKNLVSYLVSELYVEKDGKLYQFSPEAGDRLPEYRLNNTRAAITSESENSITCDITIDMYFDDGPNSPYTRQEYETESISFILEDGRWVIDNHFSHNLYAPYTWDEQSPLGGFADVPVTEELREFVPNS